MIQGLILRRILVVDDLVDLADSLAEAIAVDLHNRVSVTVANNGLQAVQMARAQMPATVIMDIEMPVMGGIEAAALIREAAGGRGLHLIAVSGNRSAVESVCLHETAFDDGLLKPVDYERLLALIESRPMQP